MSRATTAALALGAVLALGCEQEEATRTVELQVAGNVSTASLSWRDDAGGHQQTGVELPWIRRYEAREGDAVFVAASSGGASTSLWIRVLEDGEEVLVVPGCLCDGRAVTATAQGVVGHWE